MRIELRKRMHDDHVSWHHDVVAIPESEEESAMIDKAFGSGVREDGLIAELKGQVRLSDDVGEHYILLQLSTTSVVLEP